MRAELFFDGERSAAKLSRFWLLLPLSAVIATAGVISDSTATVIGAMIVAPLMTPILGSALAIALGDWRNLVRSVVLVVTGALAVFGIAYVFASMLDFQVVAQSNSQVAARVAPHLVDLVAALATGAVGAVALARSDISDTLPGVAIAISLVPPLAVVGVTAQAKAYHQAAGALLLFVTNVVAIVLSGLVVLAIYRLNRRARPGTLRRRTAATVAVVVAAVAIGVPLAHSSHDVGRTAALLQGVGRVAQVWTKGSSYAVETVTISGGEVLVRIIGTGTPPSTEIFRHELDGAGLGATSVEVQAIPAITTELPGR